MREKENQSPCIPDGGGERKKACEKKEEKMSAAEMRGG